MRKFAFCFVLVAAFSAAGPASQAAPADHERLTILLTNDNGIDDVKIRALAKHLARDHEVWVVAPDQDRSGSGNYLPNASRGRINAKPMVLGDNIRAWAVDGFPADCVVLALAGIMQDNPPDLVLSGINGGPNLGPDWMFSGTIGAARVAALGGFKSIALSGLQDDFPDAIRATNQWVSRLILSEPVVNMNAGEYLTVSFTRTVPSAVKGIKIADRSPVDELPAFALAEGDELTWRASGSHPLVPEDSQPMDRELHAQGFVTIVPMRVGEVDHDRLQTLKVSDFPEWQIP